jgi:heme oxygenase
MPHSGRRFDLRNRTRQGHERLDAAVGVFVTLADYRRYLACLGAFRAAMDRALQDIAWPEGWSWRPTRIVDQLARDAKDLGLPPARDRKADVDLTDLSALLGALYVLEGSTLGAQVLRQRAAALGLDRDFGARHLDHMSNDIAQWRAFLLLLDGARDFDIERAAASANDVFALALRCFESELLVEH